MAIRNPSRFESYTLTEEEARSGAMLSTLNKMFIQNLLHDELIKRTNISVDPLNIQAFIQEEAACKSAIVCYTHLLECSETAEKELYMLQSGNMLSNNSGV